MPKLFVDGLDFDFPTGWQASKYDEWAFYRQQFGKLKGTKAVDILAISPLNKAFLIEVKDYRHPDTEKPSELAQAIADKVIHTLAALFPAKLLANDPIEKAMATGLLNCVAVQVVLHIELPARHRPVVDLADLEQKTRRLLRAVAPPI